MGSTVPEEKLSDTWKEATGSGSEDGKASPLKDIYNEKSAPPKKLTGSFNEKAKKEERKKEKKQDRKKDQK